MAYTDVPKDYGPHMFTKDDKGAQEFHYFLMVKLPKLFQTEYKAPLLQGNGVMIWHPKSQKDSILALYVYHVYRNVS